jgi:hypothetical protein
VRATWAAAQASTKASCLSTSVASDEGVTEYWIRRRTPWSTAECRRGPIVALTLRTSSSSPPGLPLLEQVGWSQPAPLIAISSRVVVLAHWSPRHATGPHPQCFRARPGSVGAEPTQLPTRASRLPSCRQRQVSSGSPRQVCVRAERSALTVRVLDDRVLRDRTPGRGRSQRCCCESRPPPEPTWLHPEREARGSRFASKSGRSIPCLAHSKHRAEPFWRGLASDILSHRHPAPGLITTDGHSIGEAKILAGALFSEPIRQETLAASALATWTKVVEVTIRTRPASPRSVSPRIPYPSSDGPAPGAARPPAHQGGDGLVPERQGDGAWATRNISSRSACGTRWSSRSSARSSACTGT